jgi:sucrose-6-phosphate hydrolase SacC (GH32 family)
LRVYLDHSSIELFVGDGDLVLTAQFFPLGSGCEVGVFSTGGTTRFAQVRAWPLEAAL